VFTVTTLVFETRQGQKIASSPNRPELFLGPHPPSDSMGTGILSGGQGGRCV